jgi:hypothetical protein
MLSELPPTPAVESSLPPPEPAQAAPAPVPRSPRRVIVAPTSPRKSPAKTSIRKATRIKRKSSLAPSSPKKSKVEPAYETEVITEQLPPPPSLSTALLPTTFVLPPPSPHSAFPSSPPLPSLMSMPSNAHIPFPSLQSFTPPEEPPASTTPTSPGPETPHFRRPYPIAKPFAPRMIHAYSPVRPSPLSRILQLGNSPSSPLFDLGSLPEVDEHQSEDQNPFSSPPHEPDPEPEMTLAQELGIPDSPPRRSGSPLLDNNVLPIPTKHRTKPAQSAGATATRKGRVAEPKHRLTAQEKGKAKAVNGKTTTAGVVKEKENTQNQRQKVPPTLAPRGKITTGGGATRSLGPPRRVPIAEVSRTRKL